MEIQFNYCGDRPVFSSILKYALLFIMLPLVAAAAWKSSLLTTLESATLRCQSGSSANSLFDDINTDSEESQRLDRISCHLIRRIHVKDALVSNLIEGRMTLKEVTAQFLLLNKDDPVIMQEIRRMYPGATEVEASARNVISYAGSSLASESPFRRLQALARFEVEFQDLCSGCGKKAE